MLKYSYFPLEKATQEPSEDGFWELMADRYWVVHAEKGLAFYDPKGKGRLSCPQCNSNRSVTERLCQEGHEVRFIKKVWLRHDCSDYV